MPGVPPAARDEVNKPAEPRCIVRRRICDMLRNGAWRLFVLLPAILLVPACDRDDPTGPVAPVAPALVQAEAALGNVLTPSASMAVVMSGLDSPRGLEFGPEGGLYVTEAGRAETNGGCVQFMEGPMLSTKCWSGTGSVSRLLRGVQTRIASGLPSTHIVVSGFASGPQDISFLGRGSAHVVLGWGGAPELRAQMGAGAEKAGTLIQLQPNGGWRTIADVTAFEGFDNPAGGILDSNPYGVLAEAGQTFVADAGGNSLLEVSASGRVSLVATFPDVAAPAPFNTTEAVPTRIRRGPDGALYVSTLSGVPFTTGAAKIYRVVAGQAPQPYLEGFKTITDFAFAPDGGVYVLQFASSFLFLDGPGALLHVAPDGTRTTITTALFHPTGITVASDGTAYVSNRGTSSGTGEVLRLSP